MPSSQDGVVTPEVDTHDVEVHGALGGGFGGKGEGSGGLGGGFGGVQVVDTSHWPARQEGREAQTKELLEQFRAT